MFLIMRFIFNYAISFAVFFLFTEECPIVFRDAEHYESGKKWEKKLASKCELCQRIVASHVHTFRLGPWTRESAPWTHGKFLFPFRIQFPDPLV